MALAPLPTESPPAGPDRLPTLTEIVDLRPPMAEPTVPANALVPDAAPGDAAVTTPTIDVEVLIDRVLAELWPRVETLLEPRLRDILAPALARAADVLMRDTREGLAVTLRELVSDAVEQALRRPAEESTLD